MGLPGIGIEPTRYYYRRILSPLRLPIPPPRRIILVHFNTRLFGKILRLFCNFRVDIIKYSRENDSDIAKHFSVESNIFIRSHLDES